MSSKRIGWCMLAAMMVLLATTHTDARTKRRGSRPFALWAHVVDFDSDGHSGPRTRRRSFEGYETHTIEFDVVRRPGSEHERPIEVRLYLPNGDLYEAVDVAPLEGTDEDGRRRRRLAPTATARLRVSGTVITRYGLYGEWRADLCWELGSETSCTRGLAFEIR